MARRNLKEEVVEEVVTEEPNGEAEAEDTDAEVGGRRKTISCRISEDYESILTTVADGTKGARVFSVTTLSADIQKRLAAFGLMKKLGSQGACAGRSGTEAEEAQDAVYESLASGKWSAKQPAKRVVKVSISDTAARLAAMSDEDRAKALESLAAIGVDVSQFVA